MQSSRKILLPLLLVLSLAACQRNPAPSHPNQLSTLDGQAYDVLYTAQAALKEAAAQFKAGTLPQSSKPVYTAAAAAYNNCQAAWKTYRAILQNPQSGDLTAVTKALQDQMALLNQSIVALKQLGVK